MTPVTIFALFSVFIVGCQAHHNYSSPRDLSWPYDLTSPFSYRTKGPINIETSKVRVLNLPLLKHGTARYEVFTVRNNGRTLGVYTNGPISCTSLSGGPVGNGLYSFSFMYFYWNRDYRSSCCSTIDGEGYPLVAAAHYWNVKYGSFQNAINKRDGLVITLTNIKVEGYIDNPLFTEFGATIKNLSKPGSYALTGSNPPFIWDNIIGQAQLYYTYPGAFIDLEHHDEQYDSATVIQFPKSVTPYISISQFHNFLSLLGPDGAPLNPCLRPYPSEGRPVIEAAWTVSGKLETNIG